MDWSIDFLSNAWLTEFYKNYSVVLDWAWSIIKSILIAAGGTSGVIGWFKWKAKRDPEVKTNTIGEYFQKVGERNAAKKVKNGK